MKLSIALAGIRTQNWLALYQSIRNSTSLPKEEYELVIVSPYDLLLSYRANLIFVWLRTGAILLVVTN